MIVSRADRRAVRFAGGLAATSLASALCLVLLPAADAAAQSRLTPPPQSQSPQSLSPRTLDPAPTAPAPQAAPAETSKPAEPQSQGTGSLLPLGVDAAPLAAIDPDSVGPLSQDQGGFDYEMWNGTRRGVVEAMLPQMPAATVSPIVRDLMRRLLLTNAKVPAGEAKKSLIVLRVGQLAAMGDTAGVESLLKVAPSRGTDPALLRVEADMLFLESDNARVCSLIAGQSGTTNDAYWRKAEIFCLALAGEQDRAYLGANLLRDNGEKDALFYDLLDTLTGVAKPKIESMTTAQPLHFAMARAAKIAMPADIVTAKQPALLRLIATTPTLPPEQRIDAAERAEAMGVIDTKVLRDIYAGMAFSKEQLANALASAQSDRDAMSRALLYARASKETVPTALAQIVQQALALARGTERYQTQARVYRDLIARLAPSSDVVALAPDAARAMMLAGDQARANRWFDLLRASAVLDDKSAHLRDRLIPLVRLAGEMDDAEWAADAVANWYAATAAGDTAKPDADELRNQAVLLFNLLEAMGDSVADAQWEKTVSGGSTVVPNAALWRQLNAASVAARVGETVMLGTVALGAGSPGDADPTALRLVVESLRGVGLVGESRALALEAAISAGL